MQSPGLQAWEDLGRAPRTLDAYARGLAEYLSLCEREGVDPLVAGRAHVGVFVRELTSRPHRRGANVVSITSGAGLANATVQQRLVPVRLFYDFHMEEGLRPSNPVGRGRYTPGRRGGGQERGLVPRFSRLPWIPDEQQWRDLLDVARCEPVRNRVMLALAYDAALRREELCSLRTPPSADAGGLALQGLGPGLGEHRRPGGTRLVHSVGSGSRPCEAGRQHLVRRRSHRTPGALLSTACFVIVSYLSGARPGEVLHLRRGCVEHDTASELWLMTGRHYKNAVDADGNKLPAGAPRRDPWVVIAPVARAVAVLERLHPHPLLFPNRITPHQQHLRDIKRRGEARTDGQITRDLAAFVTWVNTECRRVDRTDAIPPDKRGRLTASRFRRTLAWFIRRRARGLVAASIQYGHLHTRMLQGYAGSYESGFPDEYAFEDWLYRLEILADDAQALDDGEHVSGPAADAYRHRVTAAIRQFAGHVLTSDRQAATCWETRSCRSTTPKA